MCFTLTYCRLLFKTAALNQRCQILGHLTDFTNLDTFFALDHASDTRTEVICGFGHRQTKQGEWSYEHLMISFLVVLNSH